MERRAYDTGTVLSGAGHAALIGWMVLGGVFTSEPPDVQVQSVSVISAGEFEALLNEAPTPEAAIAVAQPEAVAPPDPVEPVAAPEPEPVPEIAEVAPITPPDPLPVPEPPQEDVAVLAPEVTETPAPQQADRVAPEPTPEPEPEAIPDPEPQDAVQDEGTTETPEQPAQEATAPPESTTELVTEADEPSGAPETSLRPPRNRPTRPTQTAEAPAPEPEPAAEPEPEAAPEEDTTSAAVADAVAAALNQADTPAPRSGPPLTGSEREGLRVAVSSCWNVGALSTEAQETKVTVYVAMNENGTPKADTIRMVGSSGGSDAAARRVFDTARRAIIRCGARGFPLPVEKYGQWREIEMTFDPEGMFWR